MAIGVEIALGIRLGVVIHVRSLFGSPWEETSTVVFFTGSVNETVLMK